MYRRMMGQQGNNELGCTYVWKGAARQLRCNYVICLEVSKKTTKPQDFRCPDCNSNRISPEQKSEALPFGPFYVVDEKIWGKKFKK